MILIPPSNLKHHSAYRKRPRSRGVALVLVLAVLIVTALLVIGFFAAVSQDRTASDFYESGTNARQLSDTAIGVVMAQIGEATSKTNEAWISQPGLIRTYTPAGASAAYKLYSANSMKVNGAYNPLTAVAAEVPSGWAGLTNDFVDLNAPVITRRTGSSGVITETDFPIVDLAATNIVEGFAVVNDAPAATASSPLPMPVRWIYVLKDGTLATAAEASKPGAEAVGRVAFWTDDESCKVNLNTASDGVFYDTPVANTQEDHDLGIYQPMAQEYQRFPGHPSETSLASIIPYLRNTSNPVTRSQLASRLTPRIGWGGSEGGTKKAWAVKNPTVSDPDRLLVSTDEIIFGRSASNTWMGSGGIRNRLDLGSDANVQKEISKLGFFATTQSKAPELNLLNRPRITLWPFNTELLSDPSKLTPEDRLIRRASELGSNKRKMFFQRANAWDPLSDYRDISENQDLYKYLQWSTQQPFPSANTARAGTETFQDKFGSLGRDEILTSMFDYLRSNLNALNQAYLPVGGAAYSFPQNHTSDIVGFNDITPLVIPSGSSFTKGLGNGSPVLNEFIMQFYVCKGTPTGPSPEQQEAAKPEYLIDEHDAVVTPGNGLVPKYYVRKIQMVILMDFSLVVNNLSSSMPRFQVEIKGNPFLLGPDLASQALRHVDIRAEYGVWDSTVTRQSLGFPQTTGNVNLYCSPFAQFDFKEVNVMGGSLGLGYGMVAPKSNSARTDFRNISFTGKGFNRAANYLNYPFYGDIVEIRMPVRKGADLQPLKDLNGAYVVAPDYEPTLFLDGSVIDITIYPGLTKGATTLTQTHPINGTNYTQKINSFQIEDTVMPAPKLGSSTKQMDDDNRDKAVTTPTYADLADYSKRYIYYALNMVMNTPRAPQGGVSANITLDSMDVFRGFSLSGDSGAYGDLRVVAANRDVPGSWYKPNPRYFDMNQFHGTAMLSTHQAHAPTSEEIATSTNVRDTNLDTLRSKMGRLLTSDVAYGPAGEGRSASRAVDGAVRRNASGGMGASLMGDVTTGYGSKQDGALVKGPDVGAVSLDLGNTPYYKSEIARSGTNDTVGSNAGYFINFAGLLFSPWKQMPSAVKFGTLPARAVDSSPGPWETLLFNPVPTSGKETHRGWTSLPRDHYWLDLFTMPVVEPYAMTENLATAGKINLNQQIAPFTYIKRDTGLHALLRNMQVVAIPDAKIATYKSPPSAYRRTTATTDKYRLKIDVNQTVQKITDRLAANDPFVSASEICEIPMVPEGASANLDSFWENHRLTGDDLREMPYDHVYPRVTTRSNTYKVYYWTQSLKGKPGAWTVTGQSRGAQTIERFLNLDAEAYGVASGPAPEMFPSLAGDDPVTGRPYYRFRTVEHKQFAP